MPPSRRSFQSTIVGTPRGATASFGTGRAGATGIVVAAAAAAAIRAASEIVAPALADVIAFTAAFLF